METFATLAFVSAVSLILGVGASVSQTFQKTLYFPAHAQMVVLDTKNIVAEEHEAAGDRLLVDSLKTEDIVEKKMLQSRAYEHYVAADISTHGPYKV